MKSGAPELKEIIEPGTEYSRTFNATDLNPFLTQVNNLHEATSQRSEDDIQEQPEHLSS